MGTSEQRGWERFRAIADGNRSEWQRTVMENRPLQRDLSKLRPKYGLPLPTLDATRFYDEQYKLAEQHVNEQFAEYERLHVKGSAEGQTFTYSIPLREELRQLAIEHGLNWKKWGRNLEMLAVFGKERAPLGFNIGFPGATGKSLDGGGYLLEVQLTPSVDVTNPVVQRYLADVHKKNVLASEPPPEPTPIDGTRELDWRPLQEWLKRHPDFTYDDIAPYVGRTANTIRKKVAELGGK